MHNDFSAIALPSHNARCFTFTKDPRSTANEQQREWFCLVSDFEELKSPCSSLLSVYFNHRMPIALCKPRLLAASLSTLLLQVWCSEQDEEEDEEEEEEEEQGRRRGG